MWMCVERFSYTINKSSFFKDTSNKLFFEWVFESVLLKNYLIYDNIYIILNDKNRRDFSVDSRIASKKQDASEGDRLWQPLVGYGELP